MQAKPEQRRCHKEKCEDRDDHKFSDVKAVISDLFGNQEAKSIVNCFLIPKEISQSSSGFHSASQPSLSVFEIMVQDILTIDNLKMGLFSFFEISKSIKSSQH